MSQANIKSFRVLNNEDVMMGVLSYLCQVEPMDLPGLKLLPHNNNNLSSSAIIGEVNDGKTMHCLWESVHGKPCDINDSVDCGQHVAKDCSSCPQGNGAEQDLARPPLRTHQTGRGQTGGQPRSLGIYRTFPVSLLLSLFLSSAVGPGWLRRSCCCC